MRRRIGLLIPLFALIAAGQAVNARQAAKAPTDKFVFLHVTDTHQTASGSTEPLRKLAADAQKMDIPPAFIIDTGDVTESGRPDEYARFKEAIAPLNAAGIGFYAVPGNHDVRWSPDGKEGFAKAFGKLYQSFDYNGVHFVLLDSTVLMEHWGHFDKAEMDWLGRDLKKVRPETPIMLFMHHWIGRDGPEDRPIDNEFDLWGPLRNRNVVAIFTGHGHEDLVWKTNGVTTVMARGLYQGSYYKVTVSPLLITIDRVVKEKPGASIPIASLPMSTKAKPSQLRVAWNDPDIPYLERRRPIATLDPRAVADNPDKEASQYRIDNGPWTSMTKDLRDIWSTQFFTKSLPVGINSVDVRLTTSNNINYSDELIFEVERDNKEPTRKWAIDLDGPIQSSPLLSGTTLYVSSLDGKVTALNTENGKKRWTFTTKGQFFASPVLSGTTLLVGSTDHTLYAIDTENGKPKWHFDTPGPLFATAAVAQGVVCVGGNGTIYGIDAATGKPKWTQPSGNFFQSRAATDGKAFYLGGWDNMLYCLDAVSGTPVWKVNIGRSFYFSPAIASPTVVNGRVFVCSNDGVLHCRDAQTGDEKWFAHAPEKDDVLGYSSPEVVGLSVYVGGLGSNGTVYAFDVATGKLQWHSPTGQTIYDSSPKAAPDGKSLAIMGVRGKVSVLDCGTGRRLWGYELGPGNIFSTPEYDGRIVYTVTMANDVQAVNGPGVGAPAVRTSRKSAVEKSSAGETQ